MRIKKKKIKCSSLVSYLMAIFWLEIVLMKKYMMILNICYSVNQMIYRVIIKSSHGHKINVGSLFLCFFAFSLTFFFSLNLSPLPCLDFEFPKDLPHIGNSYEMPQCVWFWASKKSRKWKGENRLQQYAKMAVEFTRVEYKIRKLFG